MRLQVIKHADEALDAQRLYVFWHGKQFLPTFVLRRAHQPIAALVSASKDGQIMATWMSLMGYRSIRGSSNRKAVSSLVHALRAVREGCSVGITPDGPVGPAEVAKPGVVFLSQKTGVAIVPIGSAFSRTWTFRSWDRYQLPKFFSRAVCVVGKPMVIPKEGDPEEWGRRVDEAIKQVNQEARERLLNA